MNTYIVSGSVVMKVDLDITIDAEDEEEAAMLASQCYDMHIDAAIDEGHVDFNIYNIQEID